MSKPRKLRSRKAGLPPGTLVHIGEIKTPTATALLDVYLSTVSHRVNLEVRTLTVVTTIFMPATLIAGIFGMNFHEMPWLNQPAGYLYALAMMTSIACIMLVLFWQRRRI